ncbi:MAG TPA: cellulase family glycosylhydrolase [Tepidisphaeraceae bacterium]|nr:cellulase family glycosylhydrolase [Tepidisphaeraceae bacterium]
MRLQVVCLVLILSAQASFAADSTALPSERAPVPFSLGVNIHFTDPRPGEMKMLADAGFKWVRMDFGWGGIERRKGEYDFSAYDRLMKALDEYHIHPVFILDYSNRFYDDDQSPNTEEGRAAFARWAAAAAVHFKGRGIIWEMYNEPNIKFWRPTPNVDDYAQLALAVGKALREAAPSETYIGPACSTMDFKFLEACFKAGCLEYWSAVSVHPYRQKPPETVVADYKRLREMINRHAPAGKHIPIVSGEWGCSSAWRKFDESRQGEYLPRELLVNLASGVPISIWYDWHDDGTNPKESEHHFGSVHYDYHAGAQAVYDPKPAYLAMKTLSSQLANCTFSRRLDVGNDADWVLIFTGPGGDRIVAWTTGEPHEVAVPIGPGRFQDVDHTGKPLPEVAGSQKQI